MAQSSCRFYVLTTSATYLARVLIFRAVAVFIPALIAILNIYLDHYSPLPLYASKRKWHQLHDHFQVHVSTVLNTAFSAACGLSANSTRSYHLPRSVPLTPTNLFRLSAALRPLWHITFECSVLCRNTIACHRPGMHSAKATVRGSPFYTNSIRALRYDVRTFICFGPIRHCSVTKYMPWIQPSQLGSMYFRIASSTRGKFLTLKQATRRRTRKVRGSYH